MTETLSEILCKECGIKPIYETALVDGWGRTLGIVKCETPEEAEAKGMFLHKGPKYPNFENAENYIRLEEIMLTNLAKHHLTVVKWVHYWLDNTLMYEYILITKTGHKIKFKHNAIQVDNWFVERENKTDCLILFILWKVIPICGESIKQAIRETDWEY